MKISPYKTSCGDIISELDIIVFDGDGNIFRDVVVESNGVWYACSINVVMNQVIFVGGRLLRDCLEKSEIIGKLERASHHPLLPSYDKYMEVIKEIKKHALVSTVFN